MPASEFELQTLYALCMLVTRILGVFWCNAIDLDLVLPTLAGYIFYKSMEGRAESEMDRTYGEKSLGAQKSYNKEAMMTDILKSGGEANLAKVHLLRLLQFLLQTWLELVTEISAGERADKQEEAGDCWEPHHVWLYHPR